MRACLALVVLVLSFLSFGVQTTLATEPANPYPPLAETCGYLEEGQVFEFDIEDDNFPLYLACDAMWDDLSLEQILCLEGMYPVLQPNGCRPYEEKLPDPGSPIVEPDGTCWDPTWIAVDGYCYEPSYDQVTGFPFANSGNCPTDVRYVLWPVTDPTNQSGSDLCAPRLEQPVVEVEEPAIVGGEEVYKLPVTGTGPMPIAQASSREKLANRIPFMAGIVGISILAYRMRSKK